MVGKYIRLLLFLLLVGAHRMHSMDQGAKVHVSEAESMSALNATMMRELVAKTLDGDSFAADRLAVVLLSEEEGPSLDFMVALKAAMMRDLIAKALDGEKDAAAHLSALFSKGERLPSDLRPQYLIQGFDRAGCFLLSHQIRLFVIQEEQDRRLFLGLLADENRRVR